MQCSLIGEQAAEESLAVVHMLNGEILKPDRPVQVDMALDPDLVGLFVSVHGLAHWLKYLTIITSIEKTVGFVATQRFKFVPNLGKRLPTQKFND
jgi:hypothetical protein